jgi:hypothetical protein
MLSIIGILMRYRNTPLRNNGTNNKELYGTLPYEILTEK